jgi:Tfp pilus assembly protein PilV
MLWATVRRRKHKGSEAGISMIEVLFAGLVITIGSVGLMALIVTAIGTNNRNKLDTNSTLAAQMVMEEIKSQITTGAAPSIVDCGGNTWNILTAPGGALLGGGQIDFGENPAPAGYSMQYVLCTANGVQSRYDVRWNVRTVTPSSWLVIVGSRPSGASNDLKYFALPVTLRSIAGV